MDRRAGLLATLNVGALNDTPWDIVKKVSDRGQGANFWAIGDRKEVTLNGTVGYRTFSANTYYAFIIGFNHNAENEGSNRIHFQFAKTALTDGIDVALVDNRYGNKGTSAGFRMDPSDTNTGGWASSYMRNTICGTDLSSYSGTFIGALPSDLRAVLKSVTKYTDNVGNSSAAASVTATTDYIFLLAYYEVFGATVSSLNANEATKQAQYAYYSAGNSRARYKDTATSTGASWWLRSPTSNSNIQYFRILANSNGGGTAADYAYGFAPGFCV